MLLLKIKVIKVHLLTQKGISKDISKDISYDAKRAETKKAGCALALLPLVFYSHDLVMIFLSFLLFIG